MRGKRGSAEELLHLLSPAGRPGERLDTRKAEGMLSGQL